MKWLRAIAGALRRAAWLWWTDLILDLTHRSAGLGPRPIHIPDQATQAAEFDRTWATIDRWLEPGRPLGRVLDVLWPLALAGRYLTKAAARAALATQRPAATATRRGGRRRRSPPTQARGRE